jgi:hypothetical protein
MNEEAVATFGFNPVTAGTVVENVELFNLDTQQNVKLYEIFQVSILPYMQHLLFNKYIAAHENTSF